MDLFAHSVCTPGRPVRHLCKFWYKEDKSIRESGCPPCMTAMRLSMKTSLGAGTNQSMSSLSSLAPPQPPSGMLLSSTSLPPWLICSNPLYYHGGFSRSVMSDSLQPHGLLPMEPARLLCPWDSPGKNTGIGCHFLFQGNFLTQDQTWVSCIAGRFFTDEVTREAPLLPRVNSFFKFWSEYRRKWQPTPVFLPGDSHGQRSLAGCSPWGRKSWTRLSD